MPIVHRPGPHRGQQVVVAFIEHLLREHGDVLGTGFYSETLGLAEPHPVYVGGLHDVAAGQFLETATPAAWRYLVVDGDVPVADVEVSYPDDDSTEPVPFALYTSPFAAATFAALVLAEGHRRTADSAYELRFLKVPGLHFVAVWLNCARRDWLVPLGVMPRGLRAGTLHTPASILRVLRPLAIAALAFAKSEEARNMGPGFDG